MSLIHQFQLVFNLAEHADCYLEIGFGGGEHLAGLAAAMPDCDFIGAEPFINGVASLLRHIDEQQLGNIRIWPDDVRLILPTIDTASLAGAFIMFPDPWPKRRHAGRRILQSTFLDQLATIIRPGGKLVLASDDPTAKSWLLQAAIAHFGFVWTARRPEDWRQRPADLPETRYMKKADRAERCHHGFSFADVEARHKPAHKGIPKNMVCIWWTIIRYLGLPIAFLLLRDYTNNN